jgi:hypothetical protein
MTGMRILLSITLVPFVTALSGALNSVDAQWRLAVPPDTAVYMAIKLLRSDDQEDRNGAAITIQLLKRDGHLLEGSPLLRMLADSLLAVASSHQDRSGKIGAQVMMRSIDTNWRLYPLATWMALAEAEPDGVRRQGILHTVSSYPDTAEAARAIASYAERRGNSYFDVDGAIHILLEMDNNHARGALALMRRSPRIIDPEARKHLELLERTGYRR